MTDRPRPLTKAVFPVAGLGTRFLPATKVQPKEMLPLVDTPAIQYVVEEAVASGLTEVVLVTGRGASAPSRTTSTPPSSSSASCGERGKRAELAQVRGDLRAGDGVLGAPEGAARARPRHPVRAAAGGRRGVRRLPGRRHHLSRVPCMRQLLDVYERHGGPVLAVERVPREETRPLRRHRRHRRSAATCSRCTTWSRSRRRPRRRPTSPSSAATC